ncbi:MAG: NADPH:quinone oxidoreductase family protein [Kordiimonadaceae bacterium]|nr:NADPH:quinone oxidoreductase family protein [Kordiimonadaceae bacterium]
MKAVLCKELGPADQLVVGEVDTPTPGKGEVLIDVKAAGLNFPDVLMIQGKYQFQPDLPFVPGGEAAGVVTELGEGVTNVNVGDRVIFTNQVGGFAEMAVANAEMLMPFPESMPFEVAAGLTITYATTYHAFKQRAELKESETVLVLGAAGGVGLAAVELAKAAGAKVIAAASSDEKLEVCKAAGADELINYTTDDLKAKLKELTGGRGVNVVYDPVGGDYTEVAVRSMAPGGRLLVIGFAAGDIPRIPLNLCLLKQCAIVGVFWGGWARGNPAGQVQNMQDLFALYESGTIKPRVHEVFPLERVTEAFNSLTERKAKGKVILRP